MSIKRFAMKYHLLDLYDKKSSFQFYLHRELARILIGIALIGHKACYHDPSYANKERSFHLQHYEFAKYACREFQRIMNYIYSESDSVHSLSTCSLIISSFMLFCKQNISLCYY